MKGIARQSFLVPSIDEPVHDQAALRISTLPRFEGAALRARENSQVEARRNKERMRSKHPTLVLANDDSGKEVKDEGRD
ncbi:hypothetical protein VNO80_33872 [Phaseolus coccineus]|uniref:Uncharacterized protein n=1 Tax=Phaseolus coccineus TaxID=3886 RepID=A0AAN9KZG2_PHACN